MEPTTTRGDGFAHLLRAEWTRFRAVPGRVIGILVAALVVTLLGLRGASGIHFENPNGDPPPSVPVGPGGEAVTDRFFFMHRQLAGGGSITARVTSLTGIITYPPPNHDQIVAGVVPWAKAGVIVKESTKPGSAYAAAVLTGNHGVRMQYNFTADMAGRPGGASAETPRWLRLTRSGDTLTGFESTDGTHWAEIGTAHLSGLPRAVQVGLFVTSPGDVTVSEGASRFTQATAVFDQVSLQGNAAGTWSRQEVGADGVKTDWERFHRSAGVEELGGTFTVSGSGDIAPGADGPTLGCTLIGTLVGVVVVIVVAVSFATDEYRRGSARTALGPGRVLIAKAIVIGTVAFLAGLAAAGAAVLSGNQILLANRVPILPVSAFTELRLVVGTAALLAVSAVMALAVGALFRRPVPAAVIANAVIVLPYVLAAASVVPVGPSKWLLRLTPAAGFAVQQSIPEYAQVTRLFTPLAGYYPVAPWAGFVVLCGYAALALALAVFRSRLWGD
jgi:ABC-2 family transporter protein